MQLQLVKSRSMMSGLFGKVGNLLSWQKPEADRLVDGFMPLCAAALTRRGVLILAYSKM